jgi:hypothetical protein
LLYPKVIDRAAPPLWPRTSHPKLDRNHAPPPDRRSGQNAATMPMLLGIHDKTRAAEKFMMQ